MGFTRTVRQFAVILFALTLTVSANPVSPSVLNDETPLLIDDTTNLDLLPHYTQSEYESLFGDGVDPLHAAVHAEDAVLKKRQSTTSYTAVKGLPGTCQHRRKLEVLQASYATQFNMFVLALENVQKMGETEELSWFGVMGIHGSPKIPWGQPANGNYDTSRGYCTHTSPLFSTWHRPYSMLMEQWFQEKAKRIAAQFNGTAKATYTDAANRLRMPYWDWSDPTTQSNLPPAIMQSTIRVVKPAPGQANPVTVTIPNPLYEYVFKSASLRNQYFSGNFRTWTSTRRQPNTSGASNNNLANSIMQSGYTGRRSETYWALGRTTYADFNEAIEGIHNGVHTNIGGDGHMSYLDVSSFDPIFMLHHNNVDRLFAMWQAAHPGRYLQPSPPTRTFARVVDPGSFPTNQDNLNTALFPFHMSNGNWWKSDIIKNAGSIWNYGYGYDEVPCSYQGRPTSELQTFTNTKINQLYGPTQRVGMETTSNSASNQQGAQRVGGPTTSSINPDAPKKRKEWACKVLIDNSEILGSWTLYFHLGPLPYSPASWSLSPTVVGSLTSLGSPQLSSSSASDYGSPAPMHKDSKLFSKTIPLSESILSQGFLSDATYKNETRMGKYLAENLTWGIVRENKAVDLGAVKTLRIGCYSTDVEYPAENDLGTLPVYGAPKWRGKVTKGKQGGVASEEEMYDFKLVDGQEPVQLPELLKGSGGAYGGAY